jgi:hypothetical protein
MRRIDARRRSTPGPIEIVIEVRRPTLRNAIGHLVCSTGREGCAVSSEYAEPDPGGGWTCYECKATKDW